MSRARHRSRSHSSGVAQPRSRGVVDVNTTSKSLFRILQQEWSKSSDNTPLAVDLPRLVHRIRVFDASGSRIDGNEEASAQIRGTSTTSLGAPADMVRNLLAALSSTLDPEAGIVEAFDAHKWDIDVFPSQLGEFVLPFQASATLSVLKACTQAMVVPTAMWIKSSLMPDTRFGTRDDRGTWWISVTIAESLVSVAHTKGEASVSPEPDLAFNLTWTLTVRLQQRRHDSPSPGATGSSLEMQSVDVTMLPPKSAVLAPRYRAYLELLLSPWLPVPEPEKPADSSNDNADDDDGAAAFASLRVAIHDWHISRTVTMYHVRLTGQEGTSWVLHRRFADFRRLRDVLRDQRRVELNVSFPADTARGRLPSLRLQGSLGRGVKLKDNLQSTRQQVLERWLRELLRHPARVFPEVQAFFLDDLAPTTSTPDGGDDHGQV